MKLFQKLGWSGLALSAALTTTGCYGNFNLTQRYWHWNGHVTENKWANEGIFLVSVIIPVYEVCALADFWFFNSWAFWTNKELVDAPSGDHKMSGKLDDKHDYTLTRVADNQIKVELFEDGNLQKTLTIDQSNGQNSVLRDVDGTVLGTAEQQPDGTVALVAAR
jgi:hypothetical protein